jgi:hypothetical protein
MIACVGVPQRIGLQVLQQRPDNDLAHLWHTIQCCATQCRLSHHKTRLVSAPNQTKPNQTKPNQTKPIIIHATTTTVVSIQEASRRVGCIAVVTATRQQQPVQEAESEPTTASRWESPPLDHPTETRICIHSMTERSPPHRLHSMMMMMKTGWQLLGCCRSARFPRSCTSAWTGPRD